MKRKSKQKNYHPFKKDENGNVISFRFFVYGNDPQANQKKIYSSVWKIPQHLIGGKPSEIEHERLKAELSFRDEVKEKSKYVVPINPNDKILFLDYAKEWAERIIIKNPEGYNYYNKAQKALGLFKLHFDKVLIKDMNPIIIQRFYDWLCTRTYRKDIVVVKKSIQHLIDERKQNDRRYRCWQLAKDCGFTKTTLIFARRIGQRIELSTAKSICKYFGVAFDRYFDLTTEEVKYSKESNSGEKRILVTILADAKKKRIIPINYATKDFTDKITGTTREKEIYNEEEATEFVLKLLQEKDIRKKTAFAIYIFMGLRSAEVCGLEWKDIDFENRLLSVNRNFSYYGKKFGSRQKGTKSEDSTRTISMPSQLVEILKEYKVWWDSQKIACGDLWERTDKLMTRDDGGTRVPTTLACWLRDAQMRYGMRRIPPHSLRHTNITMQLIAGVPIKTIAERAGHADAGITLSVYSHFLKENDKKAADIINDMFCKKINVV